MRMTLASSIDDTKAYLRRSRRLQTLTAVQHHNRLLALAALNAWRNWTPPAELTHQAQKTDARAVSCALASVIPRPARSAG